MPDKMHSKNLTDINQDNFKKEVLDCEIPVFVDFWAPWCMPCRMIAPVIEELSDDYAGKVKFAKVNVDESPQLATDMQILSIPALILFRNGKEIKRIQGVNTKEYIRKEIDLCIS